MGTRYVRDFPAVESIEILHKDRASVSVEKVHSEFSIGDQVDIKVRMIQSKAQK